jgi:potassium-dependent mechanosensitive channel
MISQEGPPTEEAAQAVGNFFGLPPLSTADVGDLAAVAGIVLAVLLLARLLAKWLCRWLERTIVPRFTAAEHQRLPQSEHFAAAVAGLGALALLTIAAAAYRWAPYSNLLFDLAIAMTAALAARRLALAFSVSGSAATAIAAVCGFAVLTRRYEQLAFVQRSLDGFAVTFGEINISLLDVLSILFAGVVLYALVRLANQGAKASSGQVYRQAGP